MECTFFNISLNGDDIAYGLAPEGFPIHQRIRLPIAFRKMLLDVFYECIYISTLKENARGDLQIVFVVDSS